MTLSRHLTLTSTPINIVRITYSIIYARPRSRAYFEGFRRFPQQEPLRDIILPTLYDLTLGLFAEDTR